MNGAVPGIYGKVYHAMGVYPDSFFVQAGSLLLEAAALGQCNTAVGPDDPPPGESVDLGT
jgi:hypothetical protein